MAVVSSYFRRVDFSSVVVTLLLYFVLASVWLNPGWVPEQYFGPVSRWIQSAHRSYSDNARQGLIAIPVIHSLECMVALRRCLKLGINSSTTVVWLLQTLLFGIGSLKYLLWPQEDTVSSKKQR